jgi:hypothetical protein
LEKQESPIEYPKITVPGHGVFIVKFGMGAQYTLEKELGVDFIQVAKNIQEWVPRQDEQGNTIPGRVSQSFLFDVLSACLAGSGLKIPARDLADCFTWETLPDVAKAVAEAFAKTQWPTRPKLQEPSTTQEQAKPN